MLSHEKFKQQRRAVGFSLVIHHPTGVEIDVQNLMFFQKLFMLFKLS